jgi:hypothetical protein
MAVEIDTVVNEANDGTQALLTIRFVQLVFKDNSTNLYNSLAVGGGMLIQDVH